MISGIPTLGVRFDIGKVNAGAYGARCWEIVWSVIGPDALAGAALWEGDTAASMEGRENVYCIAIQNVGPDAIAAIRSALSASAAFAQVKAEPTFCDDAAVWREPLVSAGRIDASGNLGGDAWHAREGLAKARQASTSSPPPAAAESAPPSAPKAPAAISLSALEARARVAAVTRECQALMSASVRTTGLKDGIVDTAQAGREIWRRHFPSDPGPLDLSGADFSGALFTGHWTPLDGANFRNAKLDGARWTFVNIRGADFSGASMRKSAMAVFGCHECAFRGADLSGASITFLHTGDKAPSDFSNANLSNVTLKFVGNLNVVLDGANMSGLIITRMRGGSEAETKSIQDGIDRFMGLLSSKQKAQVKVKSEGGCFIATAACGDENAPEVCVLKGFREVVMRPHPIGRLLIGFYEAVSPPTADWIRRSPLRKQFVLKVLVRPAAHAAARFAGSAPGVIGPECPTEPLP